jgi:prepilin-type N-terminal cleavage/methylation domain-containing protein
MTMRSEAGFSLLELIVAMSILSVLSIAMSSFVLNSIRSTNQDYNQTVVLVNTKSAVDSVAREVRQARSVEANNSLPDSNAPGGSLLPYSWSGAAGSGSSLILAEPARDSSGNLIYADGLHTSLYTDDVIFYLDSSDHRLYKRVLANTLAPGDVATTTCPPAKATSGCPADAVVVEDVANLTTSYLNSSDQTITIPSGTEAVVFTVTESKIIGARTYSSSYTTTASLRNK